MRSRIQLTFCTSLFLCFVLLRIKQHCSSARVEVRVLVLVLVLNHSNSQQSIKLYPVCGVVDVFFMI